MSKMKDLLIDILNGINAYDEREGFEPSAFDEYEEDGIIPLMYTTDGDDEEYELQCSLDLKNMEYIRQYGDKVVRDKATPIELYTDFCGRFPVSWDSLYSWTMDIKEESEDE